MHDVPPASRFTQSFGDLTHPCWSDSFRFWFMQVQICVKIVTPFTKKSMKNNIQGLKLLTSNVQRTRVKAHTVMWMKKVISDFSVEFSVGFETNGNLSHRADVKCIRLSEMKWNFMKLRSRQMTIEYKRNLSTKWQLFHNCKMQIRLSCIHMTIPFKTNNT